MLGDRWKNDRLHGVLIISVFNLGSLSRSRWAMQPLLPTLLLALCAATPAAFAIPRSLLDPFGPADHKIYYQVRTEDGHAHYSAFRPKHARSAGLRVAVFGTARRGGGGGGLSMARRLCAPFLCSRYTVSPLSHTIRAFPLPIPHIPSRPFAPRRTPRARPAHAPHTPPPPPRDR